MKVPMGPPAPRNPNPDPGPPNGALDADGHQDGTVAAGEASATLAVVEPEMEAAEGDGGINTSTNSASAQQRRNSAVPYSIPPWSEPPELPFFLEVLKDGAIIEQLDVCKKGAYMFGRVDLCDFVLEHPSVSRFHAVLQFKQNEVFLYDTGSTHGTFINKTEVKKKAYVEVHVGDVIRFGLSSRLYIFQGPTELMPPEGDLEKIRKAKIHQEMLDREASLSRARVDASLADGISWGLDEDAIEEDTEDGTDEITWKTYKGQLTERQEKTRGKIIKRIEKVANMKKEIDAIRAKDIAQGGLTQGQQTQIARNEQRMTQIMEELESLEETLNDSIRESLGARSRKLVRGRKKADFEDEDMLSDDDDFYDRTKKKARRTARESAEQKSVETSDSLLDKKEIIVGQMEEKKALLRKEQEKEEMKTNESTNAGDDLDTYMADLSSQLVHDRIAQIQDELSALQTELDKVMYLLKIADPMGEATRKRELKTQTPAPVPDVSKSTSSGRKQDSQQKINATVTKAESAEHAQAESAEHAQEESGEHAQTESAEHAQAEEHATETKADTEDNKVALPVYSSMKPQWLGATRETEREENMIQDTQLDENELDNFVDYKDRNKALSMKNDTEEIEHAAPGLIIRKPKSTKYSNNQASNLEVSTSSDADTSAADAVALLLKHARGYSSLDEIDKNNLSDTGNEAGKDISQVKRVLGPSRPSFLEETALDYESWVPPEGQTGDGRTSLNDRFGY